MSVITNRVASQVKEARDLEMQFCGVLSSLVKHEVRRVQFVRVLDKQPATRPEWLNEEQFDFLTSHDYSSVEQMRMMERIVNQDLLFGRQLRKHWDPAAELSFSPVALDAMRQQAGDSVDRILRIRVVLPAGFAESLDAILALRQVWLRSHEEVADAVRFLHFRATQRMRLVPLGPRVDEPTCYEIFCL
ncbi:MAG TPA: hypothetical protein VJB68_04600 [Methylophilaceae bacterium]|nr:hypothetical protein [Methylophilaceae bacterium]